MTWIKLKNVGESATVVVHNLVDVRDDTLCLSTREGDLLYLPKGVALDLLRACGFGDEDGTVMYDSVVGARLHFSRVAPGVIGGAPHWMIQRLDAPASAAQLPAPIAAPIAAPIPHTPSKADTHMDTGTSEKFAKREDIHAAYESALLAALAIQRKIFKGKLAPKLTAESVAASAATMFIQYERNRCL